MIEEHIHERIANRPLGSGSSELMGKQKGKEVKIETRSEFASQVDVETIVNLKMSPRGRIKGTVHMGNDSMVTIKRQHDHWPYACSCWLERENPSCNGCVSVHWFILSTNFQSTVSTLPDTNTSSLPASAKPCYTSTRPPIARVQLQVSFYHPSILPLPPIIWWNTINTPLRESLIMVLARDPFLDHRLCGDILKIAGEQLNNGRPDLFE